MVFRKKFMHLGLAQVVVVQISSPLLMFRKRAGSSAGSEQLHYLGYRGAIYLLHLTCFC